MPASEKDVVLTIRVERELRSAFSAACDANDVPAAQVIRHFMRDYVKAQSGGAGKSTKESK